MLTIQSRSALAALVVLTILAAPAAADSLSPKLLAVEGSDTLIKLLPGGKTYQASLDHGRTFSRILPRRETIKLRRFSFDPLSADAGRRGPDLPGVLTASADSRAFIVQFVTPPLPAYREAIRRLGGTTHQYVPHQALLVRIDPGRLAELTALPFVRWAGPWHPAFRLEGVLAEMLAAGNADPTPRRYWIMALERGPAMQRLLAARIARAGGTINLTIPEGFRLEATLTPDQLLDLARSDEVLFIDRWSPPEPDMNIAREISGANHIEMVGGYTGQGVRGEAMDGGMLTTHQDFQATPPILHGPNGFTYSHGTQVYGICFGDGTGNENARGLLPDGQGIFASYYYLSNRYTHTAQLVDPAGQYRTVFQTNSWGDSQDIAYTTTSAELDDILFLNDILITQSQSNLGSRWSRPQAWAKNVVSVGGAYHYNTLTRSDDEWDHGASIGPAADGRIKPDLCHFYDETLTTGYTSDTAYDTGFGGTSGATPITAGHFGLLFQMWADGIFTGNPGAGADVFDSRPHMTTAKALMINSASPYDFLGTGHDLTRVHQGWGLAHVGDLYDLAEVSGWRLPLIVDETEIIEPLEVHSYEMTVSEPDAWFKVTLVYADPMGNPGAGLARINDLSLRVSGPDGEYYGNRGLRTRNWSTEGGEPNDYDTVENVFLATPTAGTWLIEIMADEIIEDAHLETEALDADYALVVTGQVQMASQGVPTILAGPGPNPTNTAAVRGYSTSGEANPDVDFVAYPAVEGYGTRVAAGDIEGSGFDVIVTGPGPGPVNPPLVRAFAGDGSAIPGVEFLAYGAESYGVNVSCGDLDGDGTDEIVTGPGPGAIFGPHVRGWSTAGGTVTSMPGVNFFAYGTLKYGVNTACADIDGDGMDEILTGAGPGAVFGPHVRGWNYDGTVLAPIPGVSFFAYGTNEWGVRVACGDVDDDGIDEIITSPGPGPAFAAHIRGWNYDGMTLDAIPSLNFIAFADTSYTGGGSTAVAMLE